MGALWHLKCTISPWTCMLFCEGWNNEYCIMVSGNRWLVSQWCYYLSIIFDGELSSATIKTVIFYSELSLATIKTACGPKKLRALFYVSLKILKAMIPTSLSCLLWQIWLIYFHWIYMSLELEALLVQLKTETSTVYWSFTCLHYAIT